MQSASVADMSLNQARMVTEDKSPSSVQGTGLPEFSACFPTATAGSDDEVGMRPSKKEVTLDGATDVYRQHCPLAISADIIANNREARQKAKWKTMTRHGGDVRTKRPSIRCRRQKVNLSEDLAHHHGCGCPACVVERAAEAYCFMRPEAKYSEIQQHYPRPLSASQPQVPHPGNSTEYRPKAEVKKRHLPWPRGSVEVSMRKLYKTKSSEDLFRCAEALFDQNITMPYNFKIKENPGSAGVYYNSQAKAPIPGAPALPAGYPPPPNPEQSLFE